MPWARKKIPLQGKNAKINNNALWLHQPKLSSSQKKTNICALLESLSSRLQKKWLWLVAYTSFRRLHPHVATTYSMHMNWQKKCSIDGWWFKTSYVGNTYSISCALYWLMQTCVPVKYLCSCWIYGGFSQQKYTYIYHQILI